MRVDFYVIKSQEPDQKLLIACRLIEKAYRHGHRVFIHCDHQEQAQQIDELLWTFKEDSFIPHNIQGEGPDQPPVVQIGYQNNVGNFNDILINLSQDVPAFFIKFRRIIEIVEADEESKNISRQHYRYYKQNHAEISSTEV